MSKFKSAAIISLAIFVLSGNFKGLSIIQNLSIDISIVLIIIPVLYFFNNILRTYRVNRSFIVFLMFVCFSVPILVFNSSQLTKSNEFITILFVISTVSAVLLDDYYSKRLFVKTLMYTVLVIEFLLVLGFGEWHTTGRLMLENGNPIWLSRAITILVLSLIILFIEKKIGKSAFFVIIPSVSLIILTGSKGPLISLILSIFIIYFDTLVKTKYSKNNVIRVVLLTLVMCLFIYLMYHNYTDMFSRFFSVTNGESTLVRIELYKDAINVIQENPLGIGLGNFSKYSFYSYPHNLFLEALAELGWLIGGIFIFIIFKSINGIRILSNSGAYNKILYGLFCISLLNSLVSGDLTSPKELYVLIGIGLNYRVIDLNKKEEIIDIQISVN